MYLGNRIGEAVKRGIWRSVSTMRIAMFGHSQLTPSNHSNQFSTAKVTEIVQFMTEYLDCFQINKPELRRRLSTIFPNKFEIEILVVLLHLFSALSHSIMKETRKSHVSVTKIDKSKKVKNDFMTLFNSLPHA